MDLRPHLILRLSGPSTNINLSQACSASRGQLFVVVHLCGDVNICHCINQTKMFYIFGFYLCPETQDWSGGGLSSSDILMFFENKLSCALFYCISHIVGLT